MRIRLTECDPLWVTHPLTAGRLGLTFECPVHGNGHRVSVIFSEPPDGDDALTVPPNGRNYPHSGDTFETLTVFPPIQDGEEMLFLADGELHAG